jgi:hypothetical protein
VPRVISRLLLPLALLLGMLASPAQAQIFGSDPDAGLTDSTRNVFLFGGRFHSRWVWDTAQPFGLPYEDNYFIGAGYQQFFYRSDWSFALGGEFGVGARISNTADPSSAETWAGLVLRFDGVQLFDTFRISAAITGGISIATAPIGIEEDRASAQGEQTALLFYMGPEISVTPIAAPEWETFFRIQHRSGGLGWIASLDGSNAATVGVRYKF